MTVTGMEEYQKIALRTSPNPELLSTDGRQRMLLLGSLGLCGEAGELAEIIKKHVFHGHPLDPDTAIRLIKEMGDCLWYLNYLASLFNITLDDVASVNIAKLAARYPENAFSTDRSQNRQAGDV